MTWNENEDERIPVRPAKEKRQTFDITELDDGRCKWSSWRAHKPKNPTYENYFGPGGFNRCIGSHDHVNRLHKDEWGNVFSFDPFRVIRREEPS